MLIQLTIFALAAMVMNHTFVLVLRNFQLKLLEKDDTCYESSFPIKILRRRFYAVCPQNLLTFILIFFFFVFVDLTF